MDGFASSGRRTNSSVDPMIASTRPGAAEEIGRSREELDALRPALDRRRVFGVGLSRTGTHSLTKALQVLGFNTVHYPTDPGTLGTLRRGDARFPVLEEHDGITDITVAPYYEDLDIAWPGSKFILTVREEASWLRSCQEHWGRLSPVVDEGDRVYGEIRLFLEAAVYASYGFNEERFRRVYRRHLGNVTTHFSGRSRDLLVLDIAAGEGYDRLAPFLDVPAPDSPFPHLGAIDGSERCAVPVDT